MIPLKLHISGFLSYRQPVELDFTSFELACISGQNGAGKSSLLDAITWVLFGEARKRDESLINLQSKAAEVWLTFAYEGSVFRIQRSLPRGKSALLEFQVQDGEEWRPLSERTARDTQKRIEEVLRLDYNTFINASFLLQGQADQFTQQVPGKRKEVLGRILGLEAWDTYRERTAARRKEIESRVDEIDGRLAEIDSELGEEAPRRALLQELEERLRNLTAARSAQEQTLETLRRMAAALEDQRKLAAALLTGLERSQSALASLEQRRTQKLEEQAAYEELTSRAAQIKAAYQAWQSAREELGRLDSAAARFRQQDERRQPLLMEIESARARLLEECAGLERQSAGLEELSATRLTLEAEVQAARGQVSAAEARLAERLQLEEQAHLSREQQVDLKAENERLKKEMNDLKERIEKLKVAQGAACPLCGQSLSEQHRLETLDGLEAEGTRRGDAFRANRLELDSLTGQLDAWQERLRGLAPAEQERLQASGRVMQLSERLDSLLSRAREWEQGGAQRLKELAGLLGTGAYAPEARQSLAQLNRELAALGYDAAAHDAARRAEEEARPAEEDFRRLETAREVSRQISGEVQSLEADLRERSREAAEQQKQYDAVAAALAAAAKDSPDPARAEDDLLRLREQENQVRDEAGAARQKVEVLSTLRTRRAAFASQREELNRLIARHKSLERAFGKDGVPALLIEQALPEIENRANELLERLSDGQMSVRFVTQAKYKDAKRTDLKETLEIQISDGAGLRDYEMYSGGEAFRVNFAIRLALSKVLAQRKGARLQTLVIDEGFGSQDVHGRQRLIEAINLVKDDFARILVITHLEELKDAFPTRIEVEKTPEGSSLRVV